MKNLLKLTSLILVAAFILLSCDKKDDISVTKSPVQQPTAAELEFAIQQLPAMGIDISRKMDPGIFGKATTAEFFEAYITWIMQYEDVFPVINSKFNSSDCQPSGSTYKINYFKYDTYPATGWSAWSSTNKRCLSQATRSETRWLSEPANYIILFAEAYKCEGSNCTYLGYAYSNWLLVPEH